MNEHLTLKQWQVEAHKNAKAHGFWEMPRSIGELLMLVSSELSEALEEIRNGNHVWEVTYTADCKPEGFPIELADAVLRILDMCEYLGLNLEQAMINKHKYNQTRPYKHGKKF